jgi:hypothetical protein
MRRHPGIEELKRQRLIIAGEEKVQPHSIAELIQVYLAVFLHP